MSTTRATETSKSLNSTESLILLTHDRDTSMKTNDRQYKQRIQKMYGHQCLGKVYDKEQATDENYELGVTNRRNLSIGVRGVSKPPLLPKPRFVLSPKHTNQRPVIENLQIVSKDNADNNLSFHVNEKLADACDNVINTEIDEPFLSCNSTPKFNSEENLTKMNTQSNKDDYKLVVADCLSTNNNNNNNNNNNSISLEKSDYIDASGNNIPIIITPNEEDRSSIMNCCEISSCELFQNNESSVSNTTLYSEGNEYDNEIKSIKVVNSDVNCYKFDKESEDNDSTGNSSNDSTRSVSRRLKIWFTSFGKGSNTRKRDSTFYLDADEEMGKMNVLLSDSASLSSADDRINQNEEIIVDETSKQELIVEDDTEMCGRTKNEKKAYSIIKELISSEKVFIDVLKLLSRDFKLFIESVDADYSVIPEADLSKIINEIPQLLSFNEDLLRDLQSRIDTWFDYPKISDIIVKKGPFLKLYSSYILNFENNCNFLDNCCEKYPRFNQALKRFEALDRCKKLSVKHYMLKPVQRIPQYRLLLEDYLSQLETDSLDYKDTETALRIVCDVASHANRSLQQGVHLSKLLEIQSQLGNYEIIKPGRELIMDGELYKLSRKEMQLRYFILLNDCLLYTSYYGSMVSLKVNYELSLSGMKVYLPQVEDYHNEFSIISIARSFTLRARSQSERQKWVTALNETIQEHNKKQRSFISPKLPAKGQLCDPPHLGREAPIWIPDNRVTMCQCCTAEFKVTFRRHHCRACGKVVCGTCSDNKAPLQYMNFQAARVCDDCFHYLLKEFEESNEDICEAVKNKLAVNSDELVSEIKNIRSYFKNHDPSGSKKLRKYIPTRLKEVTANDSGSRMSGWLHKRVRRGWKRYWFVLKEQVLYVYKASEDVMALDTIPVLGYTLQTFKTGSSTYDDIDSKCVFQLAHTNQPPLVYYADHEQLANRWIDALLEATSLR